MRFYLVTPSFNQLDYLKRCIASIRDQTVDGLQVHHEVIDAASTDGTVEWLKGEGVPHISESDEGMYHALNKSIDRMDPKSLRQTETIFAWLNADEQYLPGTLKTVADYFSAHPTVDILCGDALVLDENGALMTYWKSLPLRRAYLHVGTLYNLTCAIFLRARVFAKGTRFDQQLKAVADLVLMDRLLEQGAKSACLSRYLSAYTYASENISNQQHAVEERLAYFRSQSLGKRMILNPLMRLCRAGERFLRGIRREAFPLTYEVYTDDLDYRTAFTSDRVSAQWPTRAIGDGS